MGLLDGFNDPVTMGLLSAGAGMLERSGPSARPYSLGQVISGGLLGGLQGMQAGQDRLSEQRMRDMQMKRYGLAMDKDQLEMDDAKRKAEIERKIAEAAQQSMMSPQYQSLLGGGGPTVANAARMEGMQPKFDTQGFINRVMAVDPLQGLAIQQKMAKEDEAVVVNEGGTLVNKRTGQPIFNSPKAEKPLELERMLNAAGITDPAMRQKFIQQALIKQTTHAPGVSVSYGAPVAGVDAQGNPVFFQPSKGGGAPAIIPGVKPQGENGKPPTEFEAKAGLYFKSMNQATQTLSQIEKDGNPLPQPAEIVMPGQTAANVVRSQERQKYVQAQRQWIDSINRVRSGANLPEIEYDRAVMTFFPQFGDSSATVKQKSIARQQEEQAMATAAGRALKQPSGGVVDFGSLK